jgi:hypothetical protein
LAHNLTGAVAELLRELAPQDEGWRERAGGGKLLRRNSMQKTGDKVMDKVGDKEKES